MNLSNPLESLMKPAQANVLLAFLRIDQRMTGRQVARVLGSASPSGTRDTLLQLVKVGLLLAEPTTSGTFYSVNRDHLLFAAVDHAVQARTRFFDAVAATTEAAGPLGTAVLLYGSTARVRSTADSDVDLLVVFAEDTDIHARDAFTNVLSSDLHRLTGNTIQILDVSEAELAKLIAEDDPMATSWRADAQLLAGPRPRLSVATAA